MKISKQLLLCGSLIALVGCGQKNQTAPVTGYNLVTLQPEDRTISTSYSATIQGRQDIAIYPQVSGYITKLAVTEGQKVKKGQTLFIIDQVPYQAALNTAIANVKAAEASLATAKLTYENKEKLFEKNVISDVDLTTARNSYLTAQAQLAQMQAQEVNARNNLSYTDVTSPADGVIGVLPYREGALVSASLPQPLTTVSDNSQMYIYFSMTENQLLSLLKEYGSKESAIAEMPAVELKLSDGSIYGTKGRIDIPEFKNPQHATLFVDGQAPVEMEHPFEVNGFEYEIREAERCVREGRLQSDVMTGEQTVAVMRIMDEIRRQNGMRFPFER